MKHILQHSFSKVPLKKSRKKTGYPESHPFVNNPSATGRKYGADFGFANAEPDNVRRQKQDYSDWANAHDKCSKM